MTRYISAADTAKQLRQTLKAEFPGVKFSVRSRSSQTAIDVHHTDGPTRSEVQNICDRFRGATFDGMIDLETTHNTIIANPDGTIEEVHYGAKYIFANREHSPEFELELIAELERTYGFPIDRFHGRTDWGQNHSELYYRLAEQTSRPLVK